MVKHSLIILFLLAGCISSFGQKIPAVNVKTIDNQNFNTEKITNDGKPIIISFWATWCSPCKRELNNIAEVYPDWVEETGVKLIAVSIDDARNMAKVAPYVNGQGWEYEIYLDPNYDFKRAMNVNNVPHTFLIDGKGLSSGVYLLRMVSNDFVSAKKIIMLK
mgnify:CR=1 FL=1